LPRIIAGSSAGAVIAAFVGIHTWEEVAKFFKSDSIDISVFLKRDPKSSVMRKIRRFI
jgi:predicted acylesterase/phospholipase RssA